jgi:hypothetical protein
MLVIRSPQIHLFQQNARRAFITEMVVHLGTFSPPLFDTLSEASRYQTVQFGIERAEHYGFSLRGPVQLYLELMVLLGSHFDTDPQYPWATAVLNDAPSTPEIQRAEQLYQHTMNYRREVAGPEDGYMLQALINIQILAQHPLNLALHNPMASLLGEIQRIYPEKAAYLGEQALETLISKGINGARKQQFATPRGITLVVLLMLMLGHGCGADPLYPWITKALQDDHSDPETRAKRLEGKALTWLEHVIANFDQET